MEEMVEMPFLHFHFYLVPLSSKIRKTHIAHAV